jgi:hypothetical protein
MIWAYQPIITIIPIPAHMAPAKGAAISFLLDHAKFLSGNFNFQDIFFPFYRIK